MEKAQREFWGIMASNVAVVALVIALFTWNRSESRADYKHHDAILTSIQQEVTDFHGRLCALEEKYHQLERK